MSARTGIAVSLVVILAADRAVAQNVVVQQPVMGITGVSTTVSVPDRGGIGLGGVSRAGSGRITHGPLRSGTSMGIFREHSGMSVHVHIHDFEAMDRHLLNQAASRRESEPRLTGLAEHAHHSLLSRRTDTGPSQPAAESRGPRHRTEEAVSSGNRAETFYKLGRQAEERGSPSVARLHYRAALRHGCDRAEDRLAVLDLSGRP
jgi:hypothetical protein